MNTFLRTQEFDAWLSALKDKTGRARIVHRMRSAEHGNFGDCEPVGEGVSEMRIHVGPGYRVYFTRRGEVVYLLLSGGWAAAGFKDTLLRCEIGGGSWLQDGSSAGNSRLKRSS